MIMTRRRAMEAGGGFLVALAIRPAAGTAGEIVEITMQGRADGSHVWFDPVGIHIQPGQTIRWTNRDPGNSHTTTAYHPDISERPRRMPGEAKPWDSDYLLPGESFSATFAKEGVYDYYCVPHEHAGMVGRIVVGTPPAMETTNMTVAGLMPLPDVAVNSFPPVEDILANGLVRRK